MLQHDRPSGSQQRHVLRTGFAAHHEVELGPFDLSRGLTWKIKTIWAPAATVQTLATVTFNYLFQPLHPGELHVGFKNKFNTTKQALVSTD